MASMCARIQKWMDDYRQGVLPPEQTNELEGHLADCPLCGALYEEQEALHTLLNATPPPPMPSASHLAQMNRAVTERIASQNTLGSVLGRPFGILREWWYHPLSERTMATAGALGVLILGLMIGRNIGPESQTMMMAETPPPMEVARHEPVAELLPPMPSDHEALINSIELAVNSPASSFAIPAELLADSTVQPVLSRPNRENSDSLFPSLIVFREPVEEPAPGSAWVTDPTIPQEVELLRPRDNSSMGIVSAPSPVESARSATPQWGENIAEQLQRIKLDLYLRGQSDLIPEIHALENTLGQMADMASGGGMPLDAQRDFANAEDSLLRRDYHRAEAIFNQVAHEHSDSRLAALSWYHLGDICFDIHADYAAARGCYQRAVTSPHAAVFPESVLANIAHRLKILDDAAAVDYEPLNILREAEAATTHESLDRYRRLFLEYPGTEAAAVGIGSLAERAMREIPDSPSLPIQAIDLLRIYQRQGEATHGALAQLRIADIVYHRLHNLPQALIEYGEVSVPPGDVELESMVRDRIAQILDYQVSAGVR